MIPGTVQRTVPRRRQCLSPGGGLHEDRDGKREEDAESYPEDQEEGCHHTRRPLVLGLLYATESMCTALAGNGDNDSKHVTMFNSTFRPLPILRKRRECHEKMLSIDVNDFLKT